VEWIGVASGEDAKALVARLAAGGPYHGQSLLILTQKMESMTAEARTTFGGRVDTPPTEWIALVVADPVIRVTTRFISRVNRHERQQMFATNAEAIQWLDERTREDAAKVKPGAK